MRLTAEHAPLKSNLSLIRLDELRRPILDDSGSQIIARLGRFATACIGEFQRY
jgi:hypothetical protein